VSPPEVLAAVMELRRIRDEEGTVKYIGVSGYPVPLLCDIAELILQETGEPLDAVMSYANYTLQNTTLETVGLERLRAAGVSVVPNASPLGMGLLRHVGVPIGAKGDFHPAPQELRDRIAVAAKCIEDTGERLETVSIRWALESWAKVGASVGAGGKLGISVMGVSKHSELEETMRVWSSVLDGIEPVICSSKDEKSWSLGRREEVQAKGAKVQEILGEWRDYVWPSPDPSYVNVRVVKGVLNQKENSEAETAIDSVKESRL
jgi:D-arabinose 1-dehydrogenase